MRDLGSMEGMMNSMFDSLNPELLHADQTRRLRELRAEHERLVRLAEAGYASPSPRARIAGLLLRLAVLLDARIASRDGELRQPATLRHA